MAQKIATLEALEARVESLRRHEWRPGTLGARLSRNSAWSALVNDESLRIDGEVYPLGAIKVARLSRGVIWARVLVEHEDGTSTMLGGLTNRLAQAFVEFLTAACVLSALSRLNNLVGIAEQQRDRWLHFAGQRRWLAHSEVKRFIAGCPANKPGSDLREFMARQFTDVAMGYIEPERLSLLAFLDGRDLSDLAKNRNEEFLHQELVRCRAFFVSVDKNPLTDEQRQAVVTIDDNVMTVAAAGSGKTSVMVAKAGYAVTAGLFKPEEILLLAFNRKAAEELEERVRGRLGSLIDGADRIKVATFHSMGLTVITQATGATPVIAPWVDQGKELAELLDIVKELSADRVFAENWHLFQTVFSCSLPPFGAREEPEWWDPETGRRGFLTLRDETVKSQEERMICDWLADKGIDYAYERPYEHDTATATRRQYMPDFYYPSARVYHEHFALDEHGNPPPHFEGYADGVRWKRALHAERGMPLIETTSYGIRSPGGFKKLEKELRDRGVRFGEIPLTDEQMARVSDEASLLRVFRTFLSHVKSNRLTMVELRQRAQSRASQHPDRDRLFLDIFEKLWQAWDRRLAEGNYVDFDDMLGHAAVHLATGRCTMPYRLVMADEFQDTSRARGALLRELTKAEDARLFVVGDDWQAVNRFAGADISLMRDFGKFFGDHTVVKLTKTFRCPNDLCDIAGTFVMTNPYQIKKTVISTNKRKPPSVFCFQLNDIDGQDALLGKHLGSLAEKLRSQRLATPVSAYVLGRNHFSQPANLPEISDEIADVVDVRFATVHAAKGLEADYVFLMNVIVGTYGFPSKIEDDSTLWIAMPEGEDFPFAEERRLFYVALTRAKRLVTIYTDANRRSEFISELERQNGPMELRVEGGLAKERRNCPQCETGVLIVKKSRYGEFLGCSRFPQCDYTEKLKKTSER